MTIEMEMEQGRTSAVKEETEHELSRLPTLVMIPAVESMKDILLFKYWFIHPSRYNHPNKVHDAAICPISNSSAFFTEGHISR